MIDKIKRKFDEFQSADHKIAWLGQTAKWRYFRFRHRKQIPLALEFDRRHNVETADEITLDKVGVSTAEAGRGNGIYRCIPRTCSGRRWPR